MTKKVFVGLSGGVDSSVTAALLKEQGYDVTGVYMKNWSRDLPGMVCPWKEDYQDAKRVAVQLGIPFKMYDFQTEYRQKVVNYMVDEYKAGRTPNPDVMCNQEVKFKLFLAAALEDGADMIATGHYARVWHSSGAPRGVTASRTPSPYSTYGSVRASALPSAASPDEHQPNPRSLSRLNSRCPIPDSTPAALLTAANADKDQTYFLYRVTADALSRSLMPIGDFKTKDEVRAVARKFGLATAAKKDSQGICFVGKVGIKDFLLHELGPQAHGAIVDQAGREIGAHDGAIFYTVGQRHGLDVGGGLPYYVVGKDMAKNEVYVTTQLDDERLWRRELTITNLHWINGAPEEIQTANSKQQTAWGEETDSRKSIIENRLQVRTRYRQPLVGCHIELQGDTAVLRLAEEVRAITPGQSAVIYAGDQVLGGGIVI